LLLSKKADVTLDGIEPINGSDAYAIKNGKTTLYYDVKTGLKVLTSTTAERNGQKMTSTVTYNDYKDYQGIKFAYTVVMSQGRDIEISHKRGLGKWDQWFCPCRKEKLRQGW